jgi:hypothetical protein
MGKENINQEDGFMARQGYDPRKVLRLTNNSILQEYFTNRGILHGINFEDQKEADIDEIFEAITHLEPFIYRELDLTLRRIYEMACENGIIRLIEEASDYSIDLAERLSQFEGPYNKSFRVFLDHPDIFKEAEVNSFLSSLKNWKELDDMPTQEPIINSDKLASLGNAISDYHKRKEGRGHRCKVEHYKIGKRHYFCAYPENHSMLEVVYDDNSQIDRVNRQPVLEVYYQYDLELGRLLMKSSGGFKKQRFLQNIFIDTIIDPDLIVSENIRKLFQLDQVIREEVQFSTPPEDGVISVKIRSMRFTYFVGDSKRRLLLEAESTREIFDMIRSLNVPVDTAEVTQLVMEVAFQRSDKKETVKFRITYPDTCTLGDSVLELKIKQYLRDWGIDIGKVMVENS